MEGQFSDGGGRGGRGGGGGGRGRGQGRGRGRGGPAQKKKSTKNQMRSIQRLLAREGLPEKVRLEKTRELEALTGVAVENKQSERERKMAVRYHKVKFFERVKLTRSIEKLERDNPGGERSAEVDAQLARPARIYITCSTSRRDISTCPSSPEGDTEHLERKREKLRQKSRRIWSRMPRWRRRTRVARRRRRRRRRWALPRRRRREGRFLHGRRRRGGRERRRRQGYA